MARYVENFNEWVDKMNKEFYDAPAHIWTYNFPEIGLTTIVNFRTGKVTKAKCHKDDEFDAEIGIAIAWARYRGYEIPKVKRIVHSSTLKYGQHFISKLDGKDENIFIGQHPLEKKFIYSDLKGRIATMQNTIVYLIS